MKFFTKTLKTFGAVSLLSLFAINAGAAEMKDNCKGKNETECMKKGDMKSDHMKKDGMMEKGKMKVEEMKDNMMKKDDMKK